jgi:Zn-dependent protease
VLGFEIRLHYSWFFIAVLITWSLAAGLFPATHGGLLRPTYWIMGVAGAAGLFVSILIHELSHALVARRYGLEMKGITLFIFGGVAEMASEPESPRAEFFIAIAGPITSIVIALTLFVVNLGQSVGGWPVPVTGVIGYLAVINAILAAFNLLPAFPLDGGRVLRSILWHLKGDLRRATRVTAKIGAGFGTVLIALGVLGLVTANVIAGIWWILIGMFLRGAAASSYRQVVMQNELRGVPISHFMRRDPVTVSPFTAIRQLVDDYFYHDYHKMYPVVDDGRLLGCVTIGRIKAVPRDEWDERRVADVIDEVSDRNAIRDDTDAMDVLSLMKSTGVSRLMMLHDDQLAGIITLKDLLEFLSLKRELEERGKAGGDRS